MARLVRWLVRGLSHYAGLQDEEARLHAVLDHIPAMVARFDRHGRCLFVNERTLKIYGIELHQALGQRLSEFLPPETYALYLPHLALVLAGRRARFEGSGEMAGRVIHYQVSLVPDFGAGKDVTGYFLMTFDISSLREAQEGLARSEQRLRAITDNLPAGITYVDVNRRVQFANRSFRRWVGLAWADVIGKPMREVTGEAAYAEREDALVRALGGERVSFELDTPVQGGSRTLQTLYVPDCSDASGEVQGIYTLTTDITELRTAEREMAKLALSDPLTGLPNRRRLEERLPEALARSRRQGTSTGLLFLDVDHFKRINDEHGHAVGDAVLVAFARRLSGALRSVDFVARFAGDEFVVIAENLNSSEALGALAAKIVDGMAEPVETPGLTLRISTSIGAVLVGPENQRPPSELMKAADDALYKTKQRGRNGSTVENLPSVPAPAVPA